MIEEMSSYIYDEDGNLDFRNIVTYMERHLFIQYDENGTLIQEYYETDSDGDGVVDEFVTWVNDEDGVSDFTIQKM